MFPFRTKKAAPQPVAPAQPSIPQHDPADPLERRSEPLLDPRGPSLRIVPAENFAEECFSVSQRAADSANVVARIRTKAADDQNSTYNLAKLSSVESGVPDGLQNWYASNGFIGWQSMAIMAQHWLIEKACAMAARDATRNGYEISEPSGKAIGAENLTLVNKKDKDMRVLEHCMEFVKFTNIFGLRIVIFKVESDDPNYYEKPFNIDGVRRGSYRGMVQVDPYWITPILDNDALNNPASAGFYEPTYWVINGKRYHHTHVHVGRGAAVPDIMKPAYYWGGVSLTQRIYERVYAADRTANEAPLLALSKRTNVLKVDMTKAGFGFAKLVEKLKNWIFLRDNYQVRVIGKDEEMSQMETSLAHLDDLIAGQYQLVAAIAEVPYTKLMSTSPRGFGATGEYEELSYHERLESIQSEQLTPLIERHHQCLCKSLGVDACLDISWNPVGTKTPEQLAELNERKIKAASDLLDRGVISIDEERHRLRTDKHSGYSMLIQTGDPLGEREETARLMSDLVESTAALQRADAQASGEAQESEVDLFGQLSEALAELAGEGGLSSDITELVTSLESLLSAGDQKSDDVSTLLGQLGSALESLSGKAADEDRGVRKIEWHGMDVWIETNKGEKRGTFPTPLAADYGYVSGFKGADGDSVDMFVGPNPTSRMVLVINQVRADGEFDEHKCVCGYYTEAAAMKAYTDSYEPGWKGADSSKWMDLEDFKRWLMSGGKDVPI